MDKTPQTGTDPAQWSTHRGPGWKGRTGTLRDDLGTFWGPCGVSSQHAPLRSVLLAEPPKAVEVDDAAAWLMHRRPDHARMRQQCDALEEAYNKHGVTVHRASSPWPATPNQIFACDLFWMTPEGAVISRMAARQRAGEERFAAHALASLGVPILETLRAGTFEGADAAWLRPDLVAIGTEQRTDALGADAIEAIARSFGAQVRRIPLTNTVQHLLGAINVLDHDLVAVREAVLRPGDQAWLSSVGFEVLAFSDTAEIVRGLGMNFVTVAPGEVVMPAGAPTIQARLEDHGVRCETVELSEYLAAAGGPGCATGVLHRDGA